MKKLLLFAVLLSLLAACTQQVGKRGPLEGVWKMQNAEYTSDVEDSTGQKWDMVWEADEIDMQTKIYTKGYFAFVRLHPSEDEDGSGARGGSGTYELKGDTLIETYEIMEDKALIGASAAYFVKISGDTLVQQGPIEGTFPEAWKGFHLKEVYIRVE